MEPTCVTGRIWGPPLRSALAPVPQTSGCPEQTPELKAQASCAAALALAVKSREKHAQPQPAVRVGAAKISMYSRWPMRDER